MKVLSDVTLVNKYKIKDQTWGMKLACFFGFHFRTVAESYIDKGTNKQVNYIKNRTETEQLRKQISRCGTDYMYCRVCGTEWVDTWNDI